MPLKGNLRDFAFTQLLNLVNLARKTGSLIIDGSDDQAQFAFKEGKLAYARMGKQDGSLAAVLQRNKKINLAQYRTIKERGSQMSDKELGLLLINAGYLKQEDILLSLQQHFLGIVRQLFTWSEGNFRFDLDLMAPEDKITVRVSLENLIIEGVRQSKEWEQLTDEIPSLDMALKFADRPGNNLRNVNLSVEEWRVVSYINPKNTIRQISRASKMSDLEIRRVVYGLLQAGLVEIIRPEGVALVAAAGRQAFPSQNRDEQRSLINRLINRIRSL
jgi:hypothetical protein